MANADTEGRTAPIEQQTIANFEECLCTNVIGVIVAAPGYGRGKTRF